MKPWAFTVRAASTARTRSTFGVAERNVVEDGAGEDVEVLQHDADAAAQVAGVDVVEVDAVEVDLVVVEVVEAPEQLDECALAGAGGGRRWRASPPVRW